MYTYTHWQITQPLLFHNHYEYAMFILKCIYNTGMPDVYEDASILVRKSSGYGVATISRIDKIIGLFCKRDL